MNWLVLTITGIVVFVPLLLWSWLLPLLRSAAITELVVVLIVAALMMLFIGGPTVTGLLFGVTIAILALRVGVVAAIAADMFWPIVIGGVYTIDSDRFYFVNTIITLTVYGALSLWAWSAAVPRARTSVR